MSIRSVSFTVSLVALALAGCSSGDAPATGGGVTLPPNGGGPPAQVDGGWTSPSPSPSPNPSPNPSPSPSPSPGATDAGAPPPATGSQGNPSARFFLPTGEPTNTSAPTVEIDSRGGVHTVYPAYITGDAFYAYCEKDCAGPQTFKVVRLETDGTVHNAMIALDPGGRPRLLLSTAQKLYFASCDGGCGDAAAWKTTMILDHQGDREVTGEALALDPQGRPRFIMHTYRAYLGIGQKTPETFFVRCDGDCQAPASWQSSKMSNQIWESGQLRFDAAGRAHLAMVAGVIEGPAAGQKIAGYSLCERDCDQETAWAAAGLMQAFTSEIEVVRMNAAVSMALTKAGNPRVLILGKNDDGKRSIVYFECDRDCAENNWTGSYISDHAQIGPGLDLALDKDDHPRFVYTLGYNIGLSWCDDARCSAENAKWDLTKVELGSDLPKDDIILYPNCTIAAWFLHSPSIALTSAGQPRVGYQARDISGGVSRPDPTRPRCAAGTDMTLSRLALMPSYR